MKWSASIVTLWALVTLGLLFAFETYMRAASQNPSHDPKFLSTMTLILVLLSGLGIIWSTMPVLLLPACGVPPG